MSTMATTASQRLASVARGGRRETRAMAAGVVGGRRPPLDHINLDHVCRTGDVDGGAGGDHDRVAGFDKTGVPRSLDRAAPEILDVLALRDPDRRHAPFDRHLMYRPELVRQSD